MLSVFTTKFAIFVIGGLVGPAAVKSGAPHAKRIRRKSGRVKSSSSKMLTHNISIIRRRKPAESCRLAYVSGLHTGFPNCHQGRASATKFWSETVGADGNDDELSAVDHVGHRHPHLPALSSAGVNRTSSAARYSPSRGPENSIQAMRGALTVIVKIGIGSPGAFLPGTE